MESWLLLNLLISSIGLGYFLYGRNTRTIMPMACGIGMMIYPYFVTYWVWLLLIAALLMFLPWRFRF